MGLAHFVSDTAFSPIAGTSSDVPDVPANVPVICPLSFFSSENGKISQGAVSCRKESYKHSFSRSKLEIGQNLVSRPTQ